MCCQAARHPLSLPFLRHLGPCQSLPESRLPTDDPWSQPTGFGSVGFSLFFIADFLITGTLHNCSLRLLVCLLIAGRRSSFLVRPQHSPDIPTYTRHLVCFRFDFSPRGIIAFNPPKQTGNENMKGESQMTRDVCTDSFSRVWHYRMISSMPSPLH